MVFLGAVVPCSSCPCGRGAARVPAGGTLLTLVAQAAVGYLQYLPTCPLLVGIHVAGATWSAAAVGVLLGCRARHRWR
jgi:heme A synthase